MCWQLAQAHGLAIAALMRAAQRDIIERERFSAALDAGLAGAGPPRTILARMPVLGVALGQLIGADPLRFLMSGGAGGWLLVIGVSCAASGCGGPSRIASGSAAVIWSALLLAAAVLVGTGPVRGRRTPPS